jgi:putative glutathione S-transferase
MIPVSVVNWFMGPEGWTFHDGPGVIPDGLNGATRLYEIYTKANPAYSGRVTVPVLWDKQRGTIVNNESAEIIRMFNSAFDGVGAKAGDYYPAELRDDIDGLNSEIYDRVNNGVYKAGFATKQAAYEEAVRPLFATLDKIEARLAARRYLCGARITEADWRLFTTLIRFDSVYVGHFKCNIRRIVDYPKATRASFTSGQGCARLRISSTSSAIIMRATGRSIRPASFPRGLPSTSMRRTGGTALSARGELLLYKETFGNH